MTNNQLRAEAEKFRALAQSFLHKAEDHAEAGEFAKATEYVEANEIALKVMTDTIRLQREA